MRTPAETLNAALALLDEFRRGLEALEADPCGDDEIDADIAAIREQAEADISGLNTYVDQFVGGEA